MGYAFATSLTRAFMAWCFAGMGGIALARVIDARYGPLCAAIAVAAFAAACWCLWCADRQRQPCAIRLMGGRDAILYFSTDRSRHFSTRLLPHFFSATPDMAVQAIPSISVRIDRVLHWPGRLLGIVVTPQRPARRSFAILILADSLPHARFRSLASQLGCVLRGVTLIDHRHRDHGGRIVVVKHPRGR